MQWNNLDYQTQLLVIDKFGDLMLSEQNEQMQFAMASAIVELRMWSNTPCPIIAEDELGTYIAEASDNDSESWE